MQASSNTMYANLDDQDLDMMKKGADTSMPI